MVPVRILPSLVLLAVLALAGCGGGKIVTPFWYRLSEPERTEIAVIEAAVTRLCARRAMSDACRAPVISVAGGGQSGSHSWSNNVIRLPRTVLDGRHRALVAHELAHWWTGHGPQCQDDAAVQCEYEANEYAVVILRDGFGYSEREAIIAIWRQLAGLVQAGAAPLRGHPNWCAELHAFERLAGIRQSACGQTVTPSRRTP